MQHFIKVLLIVKKKYRKYRHKTYETILFYRHVTRVVQILMNKDTYLTKNNDFRVKYRVIRIIT